MAGTSAFTFVIVFHARLKILVIGSSEHQRETNEQVRPDNEVDKLPKVTLLHAGALTA